MTNILVYTLLSLLAGFGMITGAAIKMIGYSYEKKIIEINRKTYYASIHCIEPFLADSS